jgi:hypothetical protein
MVQYIHGYRRKISMSSKSLKELIKKERKKNGKEYKSKRAAKVYFILQ